MDKTQREINDAEWRNPENWAGIGPFKAYFSKRDSRIWVPLLWNSRAFSPATINLGHRYGLFALSLLFYMIIGIVAVIGWVEYHRK
jgi:uncharacterized membrane protein